LQLLIQPWQAVGNVTVAIHVFGQNDPPILVVPRILSPVNFPIGVTFVQDKSYVWDGASYSSALVLKIWGLDLNASQPVRCTWDFGDLALVTDANIVSQVDMDTMLEVDLAHQSCTGACRAEVTCVGNQIYFVVEYFTYPVPKVISMFPSEGPVSGGTLVKLSIVEYSGARSTYGAGLTNNFVSAFEGETTFALKVICESGDAAYVQGTLTQSAGVDMNSAGQVMFDLNFVMPPCPCREEAVAEFVLLFGPELVAWKLRDGTPPRFKYMGAAISYRSACSGHDSHAEHNSHGDICLCIYTHTHTPIVVCVST